MLRIALNTISLQQLSLQIWFCTKTQLLKERLSKLRATTADLLHYSNKKISTTRKTFSMQFNQPNQLMKQKVEKHLAMDPSVSKLASSCKKDLIKMALRSKTQIRLQIQKQKQKQTLETHSAEAISSKKTYRLCSRNFTSKEQHQSSQATNLCTTMALSRQK